MSLGEKLYSWLKKQPLSWVSGVYIEKMVSKNTKHGGSYTTRELRRLAEEKLIEREERSVNGKRLAYYRYNPKVNGLELARRSIEWWDSL